MFLIGTTKTDADLSILKGANNAVIGFGQFRNDILQGQVADFKIYEYAMTAEEVADQFNIPDEDKVSRDKEWLDLGDVSAVIDNLTLPTKGAAGSDISWASTDESVIAADGTVTRPEAGKGDAVVTLTATITAGDATDTKSFEVTVKQQLTAEEIVNGDAEDLKLTGLAAVNANLTLPTSGERGSTITWTSSNPDIIAADGTVTRPVGDPAEVVLTATVSYGDTSVEKEFTATVVPVYEKTDIVKVAAGGTAADIPFALCQNWIEIRNDKQAEANNCFYDMTYSNGNTRRLVRTPVKFENMGVPDYRRGPLIGEQGIDVLKEIGYNDEQIDALKANGTLYIWEDPKKA